METKEFSTYVSPNRIRQTEMRFGFHHGQFFSEYLYKNLHWVLDGETIGFGDIREKDVATLIDTLNAGEVFEGFNEHHGTRFQQTPRAMIMIMDGVISFPYKEK